MELDSGDLGMTSRIGLAVGFSVLAFGAAFATAAQAEDLSLTSPYIEFGAGGNWQELTLDNLDSDSLYYPPTSTEVSNLKLGADVYAAVGATLIPGLRAEIQGSYHTNSGARFDVESEGSATLTADSTTFMVLANLWKDFAVTQGMTFSLGAGLGLGSSQQTAESGAYTTEINTTGLAYMVGAGVGFDVGSGMVISLTYSLSGIAGGTSGQVAFDSSDNDDEPFTGDLSSSLNQSLTIGLRIPM